MDTLLALLRNTQEPAMARATALWYLSQIPDQRNLAAFGQALHDKEALVRYHALSGLMDLPMEQKIPLVVPLLHDSVKSVRTMAANALAGLAPDQLNPTMQQTYEKAKTEYQELYACALTSPVDNLS
ncbi:MAG: HEAT repeat domain-containing protein [Cytophagales bacterium]|nr:HEAT repeat domain-containing protein [Cytophagales bacterium]